jgi:hypothetical protein
MDFFWDEFRVIYDQQDEVYSLFLFPQSVEGICDLLEIYALDMITVFDVEQSDHRTIVKSANDSKIESSQINASIIVLSIKDLSRLLTYCGHYEFHMFDIDPNWNEEGIIGQVKTCQEYDWRSRNPILPSLSHSHLYLYSEDDGALTLESYNSLLLKRVFARALRIYGETWLLQTKYHTSPELSEITGDIIEQFWYDKLDLTIATRNTTYNNGRLQIGVSKRVIPKYGYPIDFLIEYDYANQTWAVAKEPAA